MSANLFEIIEVHRLFVNIAEVLTCALRVAVCLRRQTLRERLIRMCLICVASRSTRGKRIRAARSRLGQRDSMLIPAFARNVVEYITAIQSAL